MKEGVGAFEVFGDATGMGEIDGEVMASERGTECARLFKESIGAFKVFGHVEATLIK